MDFFNNEYYFTRQLLESVGLWPYEKPERRFIRMLCISFILTQSILAQLATFITHEFSTSLFIDVFSFTILCMVYSLKYNTVYFNSNHVKNLFDQIQCDWKLIRNMDELKIVKKYAYKIKFYAFFSGSIVYPGTFIFIIVIFIPDFLDFIMPLDEPRQRQLPVKIELFLDQETYFYFIPLIFTITAFVGMTIFMATENMYMIFVQHSCALFELISYRLTCAFDTCLSTPSKTKCRLCTKLLSAFNIHQHCLEFIENIQQKFSISYFILFILGVASSSVNLFRFFEAVTMHNIFLAIAIGLFVYSHICYGFFMNYFGQDIIDHSEYLFQQIYNTQWYSAPLYAQKLLLMSLRQSMRNSKIIVGGLFVMSFEGLATLLSMSMSYCMVMYSAGK